MFSVATITNGPLELDESGRWCSSNNHRQWATGGKSTYELMQLRLKRKAKTGNRSQERV